MSKPQKVDLQLQVAGGSFKKNSITLFRGGIYVTIPISKKKLAELRKHFDLPEEG